MLNNDEKDLIDVANRIGHKHYVTDDLAGLLDHKQEAVGKAVPVIAAWELRIEIKGLQNQIKQYNSDNDIENIIVYYKKYYGKIVQLNELSERNDFFEYLEPQPKIESVDLDKELKKTSDYIKQFINEDTSQNSYGVVLELCQIMSKIKPDETFFKKIELYTKIQKVVAKKLSQLDIEQLANLIQEQLATQKTYLQNQIDALTTEKQTIQEQLATQKTYSQNQITALTAENKRLNLYYKFGTPSMIFLGIVMGYISIYWY